LNKRKGNSKCESLRLETVIVQTSRTESGWLQGAGEDDVGGDPGKKTTNAMSRALQERGDKSLLVVESELTFGKMPPPANRRGIPVSCR